MSIEENVKKFSGKLIKKFRKEKGMTQQQLADITGVSHPRISQMERETACPSLNFAAVLAYVLECNIEDFLE